ncbi:MAG: polysaccharide biosynthesis protein, partial [Bacteroidetes bacterium]|nr:polysaccharide biosynthesis protein [Bacteroidota bacterium]
ALYYLEIEFRKQFPGCNVLPVIGDVLNKEKVDHLLSRHGVDLIYHAAAYKHVPMMEREPFEATHNNILATKIIAETALANRVAKCVYISTDKAVNPASIMGASKRVGELVMQAYTGVDTKFISVRFGNVIGSKGSVIPLFKKQVADGGPITVTHPDVTRYFMSISEAVQLVMTAGAMGKGGEIFLLDMGQPIKISDMANKLIKFSGLIPGKDIEIDYIGLRPGEKMHEELYWKGENVVLTANKKITMLETNGFDKEVFFKQLKQVETSDNKIESQNLFSALRELVPEGDFSIGGQG